MLLGLNTILYTTPTALLSGNVIVSLPLQYLHATVLNNNVILLLVINESFLFVYRNYHVNK